jgi:hypothetical protein
MTLSQYLNQKDPIKGVRVFLKKSELLYGVKHTMTSGSKRGEVRQQVWINSKNEIVAGIEYCLIGNMLYTVDRDGNPKNSSVFRLLLDAKSEHNKSLAMDIMIKNEHKHIEINSNGK